MRILVPIKRVPAPETRIRVLGDGSGIDLDGVSFVINPFDEIAMEEALRIREAADVEEIIAVSVGPEECVEQLRHALAMGADRAIHVAEESSLDCPGIASVLRSVVGRVEPDIVLMGKQAIDDDNNQAGQMLAGLLGWPQATFVSCIEFIEDGRRAQCVRETDAGLETIRVRLPAVLTTDLRLNEPRYVSLPGILRAKNKPLETLTLADLGAPPEPLAKCFSLSSPPSRSAGVRVGSVEELVQRLRDEARVI